MEELGWLCPKIGTKISQVMVAPSCHDAPTKFHARNIFSLQAVSYPHGSASTLHTNVPCRSILEVLNEEQDLSIAASLLKQSANLAQEVIPDPSKEAIAIIIPHNEAFSSAGML